ncbi:MAG: cation-translocating P-type ATPase [Treponema sp.]|nr:cation-translocating P-type ATPase [Treponema sp.]
MKKIIHVLESIPATIIGGIFLIASFVFPKVGIEVLGNLAWVTILISGSPLVYAAVKKLIRNKGISKISSALLISVAMIAAVLIDDLFAAAEVAFIMAIGEILEELTTGRAKKGLKKLINLAPTQGRIIRDGKEIIIPAEEIKQGDVIRILPGEAIPVDGIIISGETSVDQSVMTGESIPVDKSVNDEVFSGTINCFGSIDIKATKVGKNSSLQKLIQMVKDAEDKKAPMQRITDKWASVLVPVALVIAIITYILTKDVTRAVTVLVVFCPCALVLATPTAIMAAIGQATKHGIIIKSGEALEKMGKVNTVAFDKTGTLTYGKLEVSDVISLTELAEKELVKIAASCESKSEHPLGKSILEYAKIQNIELYQPEEFKMQSGKGVSAIINNEKIICGNEKYFEEANVKIDENVKTKLSELRLQGKVSVLIAKNQECVGIIALSDVIREEANSIVKKLSAMNTDVVLLTGDNKKTADYFAQKAGIKNVHSELLPEEKVSNIIKLQNEGKTVCMIGDGINDAPALKTANVGIAMGIMGSDIAVEASDIALMKDDISKLPYLKRLANATVKTIKFSISLSMFINFLAIALSVLGMLNPTSGALVHNAGSVFVVLIATFLYDRKFDK